MKTSVWLAQARQHKDVLASLVAQYHPGSATFAPADLPITASCPESACRFVRKEIAEEFANHEVGVRERFETAFEAGNVSEIYSLLNSAWFGVPESTSCWRIEGFSEAVGLLEDPPEEDES
jgi:hypothetical protein